MPADASTLLNRIVIITAFRYARGGSVRWHYGIQGLSGFTGFPDITAYHGWANVDITDANVTSGLLARKGQHRIRQFTGGVRHSTRAQRLPVALNGCLGPQRHLTLCIDVDAIVIGLSSVPAGFHSC